MKAQAVVEVGPTDEFRMWAPRGESASKDKAEEPEPLFTNVPMELDWDSRRASVVQDTSEVGYIVSRGSLF